MLIIKNKQTFKWIEEYIRQLDDEYNYEEVPVEDFYENGR